MRPDRFFVILNPIAGRGRAGHERGRVRSELERLGAPYELVETRGRGDAVELAERAAREGWPAVVAVGGDGTVHEVVNGLMRAAQDGAVAALGIVPVGSGNDFARLAGVPPRTVEAVRRLVGATARPVDVGRIGGRWFTNGVGIGLDARVAVEAAGVRRLRGLPLYLWALLRVLRAFRPPRMRVTADGRELADRRLTLLTIGNGARHGGGFWLCPAARIDDGELDVCVCDELTPTGILRFLPQVIRGTHVDAAFVRMHRVRRITVSSPDPLPVHADGEILADAAREVEIEIAPGRLALLA